MNYVALIEVFSSKEDYTRYAWKRFSMSEENIRNGDDPDIVFGDMFPEAIVIRVFPESRWMGELTS